MTYFNLKKIGATTLIAFSLLPMMAFAEEGRSVVDPIAPTKKVEDRLKRDDETKVTGTQKTSANFCARINDASKKFTEQIKDIETKNAEALSKKSENLEQRESQVNAKKAEARFKSDSKRVANWGKMETQARNDEQKAALATYKTTVEQALETRRIAVDTAITTYQTGVTSILSGHTASVTTAITTFKTSVEQALAKAKADCAKGVSSKNAQATFNKTINNARKMIQDARKNNEKNPAVLELKKARDEAIKTAEQAFKNTTTQARLDLQAALKK